MRYAAVCDTRIGRIWIVQEEDAIVEAGFGAAERGILRRRTPLLAKAAEQLEEYLAGVREKFDVKLHAEGSAFQERVWGELLRIPYGQTRTYGEVAAAVGSPKGARAVGAACRANPIMIFIPCHRVIGKDGSLTGFGGGLPVKEMLLGLERKV